MIETAEWAGSDPSAYSDAQWVKACALDKGGTGPVKGRYALPIRNPQGGLEKQGVKSAMALIGHVTGASPEALGTAARILQRAAAQVGLEVSDSVKAAAKS